jgi:hypothetical protein
VSRLLVGFAPPSGGQVHTLKFGGQANPTVAGFDWVGALIPKSVDMNTPELSGAMSLGGGSAAAGSVAHVARASVLTPPAWAKPTGPSVAYGDRRALPVRLDDRSVMQCRHVAPGAPLHPLLEVLPGLSRLLPVFIHAGR